MADIEDKMLLRGTLLKRWLGYVLKGMRGTDQDSSEVAGLGDAQIDLGTDGEDRHGRVQDRCGLNNKRD